MSTVDMNVSSQPMDMEVLSELENLIQEGVQISIVPHRKPDGDALGGSLALYHYFKKKGCPVEVVAPSPYAYFLEWLPGNSEVTVFSEDPDKAQQHLERSGLVFCLDFNQLSRVKQMEPLLRKTPGKKVLIDHHTYPDGIFDFNLADVNASATAEIVYDFICKMGDRELIDKSMAECIYTGILTDTGSFRFQRTTAKVHTIIADLIERGAVPHIIHERIFDSFSENRMRFYGYCLKEKLTLLPEYHTAFIPVTDREMKKFDIGRGDTEGLVNYALALKDYKFAALMKETRDMKNSDVAVKISFRSKGEFLANEFAREHFQGGGHKNAAGGICYKDLNATINEFKEAVKEYSQILQR